MDNLNYQHLRYFWAVARAETLTHAAAGLHLTPHAQSLPSAAPLYYRARALTVGAGFEFESREIWTEAGQLVALNSQTFAIIK